MKYMVTRVVMAQMNTDTQKGEYPRYTRGRYTNRIATKVKIRPAAPRTPFMPPTRHRAAIYKRANATMTMPLSMEYTLVITVSPAMLCITMTRMPTVQGAPNRNPALLVVVRDSPFFSPLVISTTTVCCPTRVPSSWILSCRIWVTTPVSKVCPVRFTISTLVI